MNPKKIKAFDKAYLRQRQERMNDLWHMGQLVAEAMNATVCNMMPFVKRRQKGSYPEEPIRILPMTKEERRMEEERELRKFIGFAGEFEKKVKSRTKNGE